MLLEESEYASEDQNSASLTEGRGSVQPTSQARSRKILNRVEQGGDRHEEDPLGEETLPLRDVWG